MPPKPPPRPVDPRSCPSGGADPGASILQILARRAADQGNAPAFRFLPQKGPLESRTYAELDHRARSLAAWLIAEGLTGERVLLLHPAGLPFVEAFFGCLYAGAIAVPAFPPRANRTLPRLGTMAADSGARVALTTALLLERSRTAASSLPSLAGLSWIASDELGTSEMRAPAAAGAGPAPESCAYLQYTSGSTSDPKGVMITHRNVIANSRAIRDGLGHDPDGRSLSWLPHFHDMGLLDGVIQPVYSGEPGYLMDPMTFLQDPSRWLTAISEHRITRSGGPNFAYDLCRRRVVPDPASLDLRSWAVAYNGAEPVRAETLRGFAERFAPCGFRDRAFYPAYGLAEATLKVTTSVRGAGATVRGFHRASLAAGRAQTRDADLDLVGTGWPAAGTTVRIVDPEAGTELGEEQVGEIWVGGASVAAGYWQNEEATRRTFGGRIAGDDTQYLRTGDLGFLSGGELFVTGRRKDLIIVRGRNVYPQDLEQTAEGVGQGLRPGGAAALGVDHAGAEGIVLVMEMERRAPADPAPLLAAIRTAIVETHEVDPAAILLVKPFSVPRTSSGKVRRAACREEYLADTLPVLAAWRAPAPDAPGAADSPAADGTPRPENVRGWLEAHLAARLGVAVDSIAGDRTLAGLGLDSLRSMELAHEIEDTFGIALGTPDLFAAASVEELARTVEHAAREGADRATATAGPGDAGSADTEPDAGTGRAESHAPVPACPVTAGQLALCFLHDLDPDSTAYTIAAALELDGPLDEAAFRSAWREVVHRHASLRARIVRQGTEYRQHFDVPFDAIYSVTTSGSVDEPAVGARIDAEAGRPFDLARGPLFRVHLFRSRETSTLLITAHHAIADLWSLSVVLQDLRSRYDGRIGDAPAAASPAATPAEFARWQRELIDGPEGEGHLAFWRKQLSDPPPALELPTVRPRASVATFDGALASFRVEPAVANALRAFARERGVTLYTVLLAAFQALLARLSGQTDVAVGAPASGRTRSRFAGLVGYLVNPVVLRADLSANPTFDDLVRDTSGRLAAALRHQDYPFATLVQRMAPPRDASRSPFFDVMFELRGVGDFVRGDLAAPGAASVDLGRGLRGVTRALPRRTAQFDLSVTATDLGDELTVEYEFNTALFDEERIGEIAEAFRVFLSEAARRPDLRIARIPVLGAADRAAARGPAPAGLPPGRRRVLSRRFEEHAALRPDTVAAVAGDTKVTYSDVNRRANALARRLQAAGVGADTPVGVVLDKSPELVIALVAVLKAGGAYVPVDPGLPRERRGFLLRDSGAVAVILPEGCDDVPGPDGIAVAALPIFHVPPPGAGDPAGNLPDTPHPGSLAYIIYTSGTTGVPKGVGVSHGNLTAAIAAWEDAYDLTSLRIHLQVAAPGFDVFTGDLARALSSGGTLVLCDRDTLLDPPALAGLCRRHRPEFADMLPATARALASHVAGPGEGPLDSFRILVVGADAWRMADYPHFRRMVGTEARILNSYGVTETTVDNTYDDVTPDDADQAAPPIGRAMSHTAAYVLDGEREPVPHGVRGELFLGGPAVSRGYIGRADLTAERFLPDPHGEPGSRMYRTGDVVRRFRDGRLEFLGRADSQVKIRGQRVEPGEIETVLQRHPAVRDVVVVAREDGAVRRLVAYVVPRDAASFDGAALRGFSQDRVPAVLVPAAFVALPELPLNANGKVDRRRLPAPVWTDAAAPAGEPTTETGSRIAALWKEVLNVAAVGPRDHFFELGGDSILVMQMVARAREEGLALSARAVFEHPVLGDLARAAEDAEAAGATRHAAAEGDCPLLPIQSWFFAQRFPNPNHWNLAVALEAREPLAIRTAERAAAALLSHHDALRARFHRAGDAWRQVVPPAGAGGPPVAELRGSADDAARELAESLDLSAGPLIRFGIVGGSTLVIVAHHLVVDGVSLRVLIEDFERFYRAAAAGVPPEFPRRTASVQEWGRRLSRSGRPAPAAPEDGAAPAPALPRDDTPAAPTEAGTATLQTDLGLRETRALLESAAAGGHSMETVLFAAVARACVQWTGDRSLRIETEGHGRDRLDLDVSRTVGWFTELRTVVLPDVPADEPVELLRAAQRALRERPPAPPPGPAAEISFNYLGRFENPGETSLFKGLRIPDAPLRSPDAARTHALEIDAMILDGRLRIRTAYSVQEFRPDTAAGFARALAAALPVVRDAAAGSSGFIGPDRPVTPLQEGMLFHHLEDRDEDPYVAQISLTLGGTVDTEALARAWQAVFDRYDALRAEFTWDGDHSPVQRIRATVKLPVTVHAETGASRAERMERIRREGFDVSRAPLARVDFFPGGPGRTEVLFTHHHLLLDGWSLPRALDTVFAAYADHVAGRTPETLPVDRTVLREYAQWQAGRSPSRAEAFFRRMLDGFDAATPLPECSARTAAGSAGAVRHAPLPTDAAARARALGVTPNTAVQAAWALVLGRCAGTRDVVFGVTSSGRSAPVEGLHSAVGLFINTLPLRARLDTGDTVGDWMRALQRHAAGLLAHEDASLAAVQRCAPLPAGTALFESLLVFENYPMDVDALRRRAPFPVLDVALHEETTYPLTLVVEGQDELTVRAIYDRRRADEGGVDRVLDRLNRALDLLLDHPEASVDSIVPLLDGEEERLRAAGTGPAADYPRAASVVDVFDRIARNQPRAEAIRFREETFTYEEVQRRSLAVAAGLRARGLGLESRVALALDRSPDFVAAALGVLRAGCAYVPLDPQSPAGRSRRMIADARAELVITEAAPRADAGGADVPAVAFGSLLDARDGEAETVAAAAGPVRIPADTAAYVMFTSGSTGEPKGIEVTHRNILNLVLAGDYLRFGPDQAVLHNSIVAFDAATFEIWGALLHGARLIIAPPGPGTAAGLARLMDDHGVTAAFLTTGLFQVLAEEEPQALARVAQVLTGGDVMSPSAIRRIQEAGCPRLCHMYGPTETTTFATFDRLAPGEDPGDRVPIGRPIANTRAYVLDASLQRSPVGAPGTLYVGGDGVSRGYVSRPDLTAERFVPDPFGPPGSRMYRTGDLARWRPDGRLEFLGRRDGQVKIRGFRVELGEVEAALAALPGVHGAAVVIAGERGAAELAAYVVADPPHDPAALRSALAGRIPPSMVPARLQFLEELPLTPAGKIDRRALPRPSTAPERTPAASGAAAATPAEAALIAIWRDVLGIPEIGPEDDFFELGGHSLHAMRVVARIRRTLDAELPLRALFDAPTVRGLARRLESATRSAAPAVRPASADARRPASYAQSRMWFLDRLEPDSAAYNIAASLRFDGPLDAAALESALTEVVRRHEALRTRFREGPDGPEQIIDPPGPVRIPVHGLEPWPAPDREAEAARRVARLARRPFHLTTGPLLRAELLRMAPGRHVLALSVHHIAADGWSVGVLSRELAEAYRAAARGQAAALPELPVQYADWAAWQREWLGDGALESQLAYWREALDGLPALSLPTDRPRPMRPTYAGATLPVRVDGNLVRRVARLAGAESTTLHMTLLAAFAAVLGRWSGQDDLGIGTPVANRTSPEAEQLIGLFVNTLVLRARLDGPLPFRDLLGRLREAALGAYAAQDVPFERVVEALQPDRDLSRTPLFQVMFILQNAPAGIMDLGDVRVRTFEAPTDTSTFDLTVSLEPGSNRTLARDDDDTPDADPDALEGAVEYSTELFDEATIRRLWSHTVRMLEAVVAEPSRDVHGVALLEPEDRDRALDVWSGRRDLVRSGRNVLDRFEEHARLTPERVAAVSGDRRVTYGEIDSRACSLAAELVRRGTGPESRVGLCVPRTPELLVGMLAAWKAGAAYVPLDPDHPRDRITFALEDAGVQVVLTVAATAELVRGNGRAVLRLDDPVEGTPTPAVAPARGTGTASGASLAYVIYTSGTTGRPKGVLIPQDAIGAAFDAWQRLYGLDGLRSHLQMAGVGFDVCTGDIVRALGSGGTLVFCDRERLLDPPALFELARREQVDFAEFVPAVLRSLVPHARRTGERIDSLRIVAVGSDAWTTAEITAFRGVFGADTRIANSYGVTEATVDSTCWFVPDGDSHGASPPIGAPLSHATTYVLDRELRPTPPGVQGELYLGGPGVGRGYAGRPDLTAERFVPDPFGEPGDRLYRTGDRARYRPDGQIVFAGRGDDQVKIRGQRVELAEIEAAVQSLPSVGSAVVVVRSDGEAARLAAYVVPDPGAPFDPETVRRLLRDRLPEAWIPQAFVPLPALPLTPNGKVDRRRLPEPVWNAAADYEPAATPTERAVAAAFAETLKVARVGAGDDFFALGGHSLLAVRAISRLRTALGSEIPVRTLFEHSRVRDLAAQLDRAAESPAESGSSAAAPAPPPVRPAGEAERRRLSFAQWRLWFLDRYEPESAAYHLATSIRMRGALDVDALQRVLTEIVRRHEALRTRFTEGPDGPEQTVEPAAPIVLEITDLTGIPDAERSAALEDASRREARARFDLSRAPLLRAHLFRIGPREHSLVVTVHHICADGWSLGVLLRELGDLYGAFVDGRPSPLPELEVQYADWAAWQRAWLSAGEAERQLAHWRADLAGVPPIALPADRPRPARPRGDGDSLDVRLDAPLRARLERLAREEGATLHMVLLAGYAAALARWSGQRDFAVGTPVANRRTEEAEPLIGFFVNTLALRLRMDDPALTFRDLVAQVRQTSLQAHSNQDVPFERVVEELQPDRTAGHSPLFQVLFALQNAPVEAGRLPGLSLAFDEPGTGATRFDLELFLAESEVQDTAEGRGTDTTGGALEGLLNYSTELFDRVTVERFLGSLAMLLEKAAGDADRPLGELPALTPDDRHRVLREWNAVDAPWTDAPLVTAIEDHARRAPQAPALRLQDSRLTYGDLDARANRLARRFLREGAGPGSHVAICLERSFDRIAAVVATLKIGAAYVPIDPDYPPDRNAGLLRQADAALVVTTSELAARVPGRAVLVLDELEAELAALPSTTPCPGPIPPDTVAYTIFTSGSTGEPKGVSLTHRALENLLAWQRRDSGGGCAPRTLQFTSLSFDVSFQEIFATLTAGGELVLIRDEDRRDPARLLDVLERERVERLFLPFVALDQLADAAVAGNRFPVALREVHTAGEQLRITPEIRAFFTALPGCRLVNQYGPAETHVVTSYDLPGPAADWPALPPIGRALPNAPVVLLDDRGHLVPIGAAGELCVGGQAPARGYHGRPDLSAERFVPDEYSGVPGARLYRTGDVARFRSDGRLEFLGRRDFQVKIRGHRVEPGEIESVLGRHPAVGQTCVRAFEHPGGARLCAYIVPAAGRELPEADLRDHVAARLPGFMVPAAFVALDALPLTPSGKVDRKSLPLPDWTRHAGDAAARTAEEEILAGILADVLGVDRVGIRDDFFTLGGHSLLATRVLSRVRRDLGVDVPLRALFESPTVEGIAAAVGAARGRPALPPIRRAREDARHRLSPAQQRLWFLHRLDPDSAAYNLPAAIRLEGDLDVGALERALSEILERHHSLRTRIVDGPAGPEARVEESPAVHLAVEALPAESLPRVLAEEAGRPFVLSRAPMLRARLFRAGPRDHVLSLVLHHIAADGWSLGVLWRELGTLYEAHVQGARATEADARLPHLEVQYADWAAWQHAWLEGGELDRQLEYWRQALDGAPPVLELPTDRARPDVATGDGATVAVRFPADVRDALASIARTEGATLHMALLAGYAWTLMRWSDTDEVVVGAPLANRRSAESEGLIGFFVNTLPLRIRPAGPDVTYRELLRHVREVSLGAYAHQDVPFERIVEELQPERSTQRAPVFQTAFALQDVHLPALEVAGLRMSPVETANDTAKFDLMLILGEDPDGLSGAFEYATDLFAEDTIERIGTSLGATLSAAVAAPDAPLLRAPWIDDTETARILATGRAGHPPSTGRVRLAHAAFEGLADREPDAPALLTAAGPIRYAELEARANRLANHLRAAGAGPEGRVAVLLERSPEAIIAILAVLKSGAAYVPLEPADPPERLAMLIADSGATMVVSDARCAGGLPAAGVPRILVDRDAGHIAANPATRPESGVRSRNLAYLVYTSGSTGGPKPVGVEHGSIAGYTSAVIERLRMEPGWRFALVSTLAADLGNTSLYAALSSGGSLLPVSPDDVLDAPRIAALFREHAIDALKIVPSHLAAWLAGQPPDGVLPRRLLVLGGEATSSALYQRLRGIAPDCRVANHYGPTETTVGTVAGFPQEGDGERGALPLGRPLAGTSAYVLDHHGRPVPVGVPGELFLGGQGVARGYLGRPEPTAERFLPDPFGDEPGARVYRTGDRARWLPDGRLEFLGRGDAQIKIRGFRVEPGEVEAALLRHPDVDQAAVIVKADDGGGRNLVAYVVPRLAAAPTVGGLPRRRLPGNLALAELNRNETDYIHREVFGLQAYLRHGITLHDGDTVFDVGGNIGMFSVYAGRVARNLRLVVFEPNPHLHPILAANLAAYCPGATLLRHGLAEREREADFTFFPGFSLLSGLYADATTEQETVRSFLENQARAGVEGADALSRDADALLAERFSGQRFRVPLRTLSGVLSAADCERIHLLKINVEKAELDVLRGIAEADWPRIDQAVVEIDLRDNLDPIRTLFESHGFDVHVEQDPLLDRTELLYLYAARRGSGRVLDPGAPPSASPRAPDTSLLEVEALRAHVAAFLPPAMVPGAWVLLERLPVTANGKLDRRKLPAPEAERREVVAPRGDRERAVARIWADVLGRESVGVHDNFFDLGGHSLLLAQVHARLRAELEAELSVVELFRYPTVAALAARLEAAPEGPDEAAEHRTRGAERRAAARARAARRLP